jgi:hypothetical protein
METFGDNFTSKNIQKFTCKYCDYKCCKNGDWKRHLLTSKHKKNALANVFGDTGDAKNIKNINSLYLCYNCNKNYSSRNGLWKHKKKCCIHDNIDIDISDKDNLIMMLVKQNSELIKETSDLKTIMMKVIENGTNNTNCNNTNSNNKSFNLNLFLNETCKDAMNIMDFVDSIKLQLSDLEKVGEIGYVEGISNIIVKNLKELDITKRPVHCTDKKRDTLYIKDEDKWEKDEEKKKMHKVIKKVADKNARLLPEFKKVHPDYNKASSKFSDQYNKIIIESMGGAGDDDYEKEEKIIKKISKEVTVEKDN